MLKPLFINRSFLFNHSPGGECLRAFVRALDRNQWQPTIYCSDKRPISEKIDGVILTEEKVSLQYIFGFVRRILPDLTWLPDYQWPAWGKGVVKQIINDLHNTDLKPDYIHSVAFPLASHWAALKIKSQTGLPWVMQFYDPWADNPYRPFKTKWLKKKDWAMERECVEAADLIIHDNEAIAQLWRERYGDEVGKKIVVLPLTIPLPKDDEVSANTHKSGEMLTISHIGNFMLNRTSQPFIHAVYVLLSKHPEYYCKLKVNYIGKVTEPEKELIYRYGLGNIFNLTGPIPVEACVDYYKNSDLFLAIDGVNKDNLFFPSKILKYFYYRRPILGITPKGSVLDGELQQAGHTSIDNSDLDGIISYLERAMTNYETLITFNKDYWLRFVPKNVVKQYKDLVERIVL